MEESGSAWPIRKRHFSDALDGAVAEKAGEITDLFVGLFFGCGDKRFQKYAKQEPEFTIVSVSPDGGRGYSHTYVDRGGNSVPKRYGILLMQDIEGRSVVRKIAKSEDGIYINVKQNYFEKKVVGTEEINMHCYLEKDARLGFYRRLEGLEKDLRGHRDFDRELKGHH